LGERIRREGIAVTAVPTSHEMAIACTNLGVPATTLLHVRPDWAFDGADEVDHRKRIIKGRGGAMFQEKMMMISSPKTVIVVDASKIVERLGSNFPVPVEVHPLAVHIVEEKLYTLGSNEVVLRLGKGKDGPVLTEAGNFILDARFAEIRDGLEAEIKTVTGVIETGLFIGYDVEVLTDSPHVVL
jgi:ribose 5-phosphate isomerase A